MPQFKSLQPLFVKAGQALSNVGDKLDYASGAVAAPEFAMTGNPQRFSTLAMGAASSLPKPLRAPVGIAAGMIGDPLNFVGGGEAAKIPKGMEALGALYKTAVEHAQPLHLNQIKVTPELQQALADVKNGILPKTNLPINAIKNSDGLWEVNDGKHRVAQAFLNGHTVFPNIANEALYRQLADQEAKLSRIRVAAHTRNGVDIAAHTRGRIFKSQ